MQLPASMTAAAVEDFLSAPAADQILVPTHARHQAAGAEAAFVQALATWANAFEPTTVRTHARSVEDDQVERLVRRLYGMCACALADRIETLSAEDITARARTMALKRIQDLSKEVPTASRGPQVEIVCADHLALSHPASLYTIDENGEARVKDLATFLTLVEDTIVGKLIGQTYRRNLPANFERTMAVALHELIRNTDEHGRVDDRGDIRRKSVRGFQARKHSLTPASLASITAASPPLSSYCSRLLPARAGNAQVQLIELSVFDSGPGMASSLTGRTSTELSREDELVEVRRCFAKHVSRKQASSDGLGLSNLAAALTKADGFMRLRTGRCALYSDFSDNPSQSFGEIPFLRNWFADDFAVPRVCGTLFTLIFPLRA